MAARRRMNRADALALRDGVTLRRLARNTSKLLLRGAPVVESSVATTRVAPPRRIPREFAQARIATASPT